MNSLDTAGIARLLGLSQRHVTDAITKRPDFPAPTMNRSRRLRRWDEAAVRAWAGLPVTSVQPSREAISEAVVR